MLLASKGRFFMSDAMAIDSMPPFAITDATAPALETVEIDRGALDGARENAITNALPESEYRAGLALGAGMALAHKLNARCARLVAANAAARAPEGAFDLVVACDALAGLEEADLRIAAAQLVGALRPGGHIVLAHWLADRGADDAASRFIFFAGEALAPVSRQRTPHFRLDVLERA
jgi:SAM-dependent methyltransferase